MRREIRLSKIEYKIRPKRFCYSGQIFIHIKPDKSQESKNGWYLWESLTEFAKAANKSMIYDFDKNTGWLTYGRNHLEVFIPIIRNITKISTNKI